MIAVSESLIEAAVSNVERQLELFDMAESQGASCSDFKLDVRLGLEEALRVLKERDESLDHIAANVSAVQSRFIALHAVDFLQGRHPFELQLIFSRDDDE